jgi:hypothetical protein
MVLGISIWAGLACVHMPWLVTHEELPILTVCRRARSDMIAGHSSAQLHVPISESGKNYHVGCGEDCGEGVRVLRRSTDLWVRSSPDQSLALHFHDEPRPGAISAQYHMECSDHSRVTPVTPDCLVWRTVFGMLPVSCDGTNLSQPSLHARAGT